MSSTPASGSQDGLFNEHLVAKTESETTAEDLVEAGAGANKRFKAFDPHAVMLVPPSLDQWLPEEHLARFIADLVDNELDLDRFYASYTKTKGQPPYDPRMMLRIVLYGYCVGVRSSRKIEQACVDVVAFRWLAGQQFPDFRSIGRFRERHLAALANVFLQALELCQAAGMVKLGRVALDGTKVRANASRHKAMSYARLTAKQKVLADQISDLMAEAKSIDTEEDARFGPGRRADELPAELATRQGRAAAMAQARASIEAEAQDKARQAAEEKARKAGKDDDDITGAGAAAAKQAVPSPKAQRNFTDPEARIMKTGSGSFEYCYNGQAVVDEAHQVIIAVDAVTQANDYGQLVPMVEQVLQNTGRLPGQWLADAGYCSKANLEHARDYSAEHGTRFLVSTRRMKHAGTVVEHPVGRIPKAATLTQRMGRALKTKTGRAGYARRKAIVEPVFGQIHTRQGKFVLLRGLEKAKAEFMVLAAGHNLMKLFSFRTAQRA